MKPAFDSLADELTLFQMSLLRHGHPLQDEQDLISAPVFTMPSPKSRPNPSSTEYESLIPQHGLLGGMTRSLREEFASDYSSSIEHVDPRIFFNVTAPSSTFICGSQGSGKSHTLSCLLEGCLLPSAAGKLTKALSGLVFHYDTFISDDGGSPCEAAFLASGQQIKVRVLCSPTNFRTIQVSGQLGYKQKRWLTALFLKRSYHALDVTIEPLKIDQFDLNSRRMMDLMAVSHDDGPVPLYVHTAQRILRELRLEQQERGGRFLYDEFKARLMDSGLTPAQLGPLNQRLEILESFMSASQVSSPATGKQGKQRKLNARMGTDWAPKAGHLTIVDLSCPCITPESACSLFNICLSIFLEQDMSIARVVALDEAHKFMNRSAEALTFTDTLLSTIRLQRHLGARVIISTQEPTISSALLDLSSVTIVHRFTSPEWLRTLRAHLAAAATDLLASELHEKEGALSAEKNIFHEIVELRVGEALLFAPSGIICLSMGDSQRRLGARYVKITVRERLTQDGGKSVMASIS